MRPGHGVEPRRHDGRRPQRVVDAEAGRDRVESPVAGAHADHGVDLGLVALVHRPGPPPGHQAGGDGRRVVQPLDHRPAGVGGHHDRGRLHHLAAREPDPGDPPAGEQDPLHPRPGADPAARGHQRPLDRRGQRPAAAHGAAHRDEVLHGVAEGAHAGAGRVGGQPPHRRSGGHHRRPQRIGGEERADDVAHRPAAPGQQRGDAPGPPVRHAPAARPAARRRRRSPPGRAPPRAGPRRGSAGSRPPRRGGPAAGRRACARRRGTGTTASSRPSRATAGPDRRRCRRARGRPGPAPRRSGWPGSSSGRSCTRSPGRRGRRRWTRTRRPRRRASTTSTSTPARAR